MAQPNPKATDAAPTLADLAAQVRDLLDQMEAIIPGVVPRDASEALRLTTGSRYAPGLVEPAVNLATESEKMRARNMFPVEEGRAAIEARDLLRPLAKRAVAFGRNLDFFVDRKLSAAGKEALRLYQWAKRAARDPEWAELRPFVEAMQRAVRRESRRNKAAPPAPAPQQTPAAFHAIEAPIDREEFPEEWQPLLAELLEDAMNTKS